MKPQTTPAGNCWNCAEPIIVCAATPCKTVPDACQGFMHEDGFHGCPPGIAPGSVAERGEGRAIVIDEAAEISQPPGDEAQHVRHALAKIASQGRMMRLPVIGALAVLGLTACGTASAPARHHAVSLPVAFSPAVTRPLAAAYMRAHPVTPVYGMDEGVVLSEQADASDAVYTWTQTLLTTDGRTVTITCGIVQAADPCTWRSDGPGPGQPQCGPLGDYEYFPASLDASNSESVVVITCGAVRS